MLTLQYFTMKSNFQPAEYEEENLQVDEEQYLAPYQQVPHRIGRSSVYSSKSGHWSEKQNTKYYAFVLQFKQKFSQKQLRRQAKVFKALSNFVKTRNANQCRSHHHKMTKGHPTIEEALEYLKSKIPSIEERAERYFQQLKKIDFSTIEAGKFAETLAEQNYHKIGNSKKERDLQDLNIHGPLEMVEPVKGTDVANMRTEATYGTELNEYQMPYHMTSPPYQSYPPFGYCYSGYETNQNPNYQLPYEMSREQMLMECHDLFLKWMSKLNVLMQY